MKVFGIILAIVSALLLLILGVLGVIFVFPGVAASDEDEYEDWIDDEDLEEGDTIFVKAEIHEKFVKSDLEKYEDIGDLTDDDYLNFVFYHLLDENDYEYGYLLKEFDYEDLERYEDPVGFFSDEDIGDEGDTVFASVEAKEYEGDMADWDVIPVASMGFNSLFLSAPCCGCFALSGVLVIVGVVLAIIGFTKKKK